MPQLSLYLDDPTMEALRQSAERDQVSLSKYTGALIRDRAVSAWPAGFWDTYGALQDPSFKEPPEPDGALDDACDFFGDGASAVR